ncbi:MAG: hypothetical protein IKI75_10260 [Lachnospiraceae bacterium]|nr:hypothetical protein [Lachnospiraceae bacterium]
MKKMLTVCAAALLLLTACGEKEEEESVSSGGLTVAEEIASGVSEDVIPAEALEYYSLEYEVPEGFEEEPGGNMDSRLYVATEGDYSYMTYLRKDNPGKDYRALQSDDYQNSLEQSLGTMVEITALDMSEEEDHYHVVIDAAYVEEDGEWHMREHIFVTEKYVFQMVYSADPHHDWQERFGSVEAALHLKNVAGASAPSAQ